MRWSRRWSLYWPLDLCIDQHLINSNVLARSNRRMIFNPKPSLGAPNDLWSKIVLSKSVLPTDGISNWTNNGTIRRSDPSGPWNLDNIEYWNVWYLARKLPKTDVQIPNRFQTNSTNSCGSQGPRWRMWGPSMINDLWENI